MPPDVWLAAESLWRWPNPPYRTRKPHTGIPPEPAEVRPPIPLAAAAERTRWVTCGDATAADPTITAAVKRITIAPPVIWGVANIFVLATGAAKAPLVAAVLQEAEPANPPVARLLRQCQGAVTFFLDKAAAGT
ncbi:MAG: 6-phosphogluconolactonase [Planctomycetota bacterium]|nr:6-phosphogluconolactonase [Planctomycetota bacterium]